MSASLRKFRAAIYAYSDAGSAGVMNSTYTRRNSAATDRLWWCSKGLPTGREATVGMKAEHRIDAVFGFDGAITLTENDAIICDGTTFLVRAVLVRDYGRNEVQVLAERTSSESLTLVNPP